MSLVNQVFSFNQVQSELSRDVNKLKGQLMDILKKKINMRGDVADALQRGEQIPHTISESKTDDFELEKQLNELRDNYNNYLSEVSLAVEDISHVFTPASSNKMLNTTFLSKDVNNIKTTINKIINYYKNVLLKPLLQNNDITQREKVLSFLLKVDSILNKIIDSLNDLLNVPFFRETDRDSIIDIHSKLSSYDFFDENILIRNYNVLKNNLLNKVRDFNDIKDIIKEQINILNNLINTGTTIASDGVNSISDYINKTMVIPIDDDETGSLRSDGTSRSDPGTARSDGTSRSDEFELMLGEPVPSPKTPEGEPPKGRPAIPRLPISSEPSTSEQPKKRRGRPPKPKPTEPSSTVEPTPEDPEGNGKQKKKGKGLIDYLKGKITGQHGTSVYYNNVNKYGGELITKLVVVRRPVDKIVNFLMNIVSVGQFSKGMKQAGYDNMFHLALIINDKYNFEKSSNLIFDTKGKNIIKSNSQTMDVPLNNNRFTIKQALDNTLKVMGEHKFYNYDGYYNNCQTMILEFLKSNGYGTQDIYNFVKQDMTEIIKETPALSKKIMDTITGLRGEIGKILPNLFGGSIKEKNKIRKVFKEFKEHKLKTPQGKIVKDPKQALAIALSYNK